MNVEDFWEPWQGEVNSWPQASKLITAIHKKWPTNLFAWRGQVDASWPLHSSLYRRLLWTRPATDPAPNENQLQTAEKKVLVSVHQWGLHHSNFGRLSVLHQLAMLQHYGAPTRLIDITFNPYIGLWFAVEQKWDNGSPKHEDVDGRLFAIDVSARIINEQSDKRDWEDDLGVPWKRLEGTERTKWCSHAYAWKPPHVERRIAAQNGGFLLGGVPVSADENRAAHLWPTGGAVAKDWWAIDEVRRSTSLALRTHKLPGDGGRVASNAVFSIRIKSTAKKPIRERLESLFGYRHLTIYPDYTGFADFATPDLKSRPK